VERTEVDGVPVFWTDGPAPYAAGLVFGVGRRDETFLHGGLTHLVEHLVMASLGRSTLEANASVDLYVTEFTASGRPDRVAEFLRRVCEALNDLPLDRLSKEADVLRVEDGQVQPSVVGALLAEQYGATGVGLAGFRDPALLQLTEDKVRVWADTWFVRGNAALWCSGRLPDGARLMLPDRTPPSRPRQRRREVALPALAETPVDGAVALGGEVERTAALPVTLGVLQGRVEDELRHQRGLSYSVASDQIHVEGAQRFAVVTADVREGQEAVAARALWRSLSRLGDQGPDDAELAHEREAIDEYLSHPYADVDEARNTATGHVSGRPVLTSAEIAEQFRSVTAEQVRAVAADLRSRALVAVPIDVDVALASLQTIPMWSADAVQGRRYARRRRAGVPRGAELRVDSHGVTLQLAAGERITIRYAEAVALLQFADREWSLVDADGRTLPLITSDWRDGDDALDRVRSAVPRELQAPADSLAPTGRSVLLAHAPEQAVAEALWPSKRDAWVVRQDPWTLIWRDGAPEVTYVYAAALSAGLGRRGVALQLIHDHGELTAVLHQRGKERVRHVWTGQQHDPVMLADALGADHDQVAALLAHAGTPQEVLAALSEGLHVPEQTAALLSGMAPGDVAGMVHEPARGVRESMRAAARGDFDPPDSTAPHHRIARWQRDRPPVYRLVNAILAAVQAVIAVLLARAADGDWTSWSGGLAVFFAFGALASLWDTRPPRRRPKDGLDDAASSPPS
jgi:hypothetical protein